MENQEYEIDLLEVAKLFLYNWKKIIVCTLLCAVIGLATAGRPSISYVATARFTVGPLQSSTSTSASGSKAYAGADITADLVFDSEEYRNQYSSISDSSKVAAYAGELMKNGIVLQPVIDELGLDTSYTALAGSISTTPADNGPILQLDVTRATEDDALAICKTIAALAPDLIVSETDISDMAVISEPVVEASSSQPALRNAAIGALVGFVLAAGVLFVRYLTSTLIHKESDLTDRLGVKVLGVIPAVKEGAEHV